MDYTDGQLNLLAKLSIDLAKWLFISAFAGPKIYSGLDLFFTLQSIILASVFTFLALKFEGTKEVSQ